MQIFVGLDWSAIFLLGVKSKFGFPPKRVPIFRSILEDRSRFLGLFGKGKVCLIAKLPKTELGSWGHYK